MMFTDFSPKVKSFWWFLKGCKKFQHFKRFPNKGWQVFDIFFQGILENQEILLLPRRETIFTLKTNELKPTKCLFYVVAPLNLQALLDFLVGLFDSGAHVAENLHRCARSQEEGRWAERCRRGFAPVANCCGLSDANQKKTAFRRECNDAAYARKLVYLELFIGRNQPTKRGMY